MHLHIIFIINIEKRKFDQNVFSTRLIRIKNLTLHILHVKNGFI